jgi:TolA-binding protein
MPGGGDVTGRALSAQRTRFPGTGAAASAAFLLGRAADDGGRTQEALGFYDRYLAEAPSGAFAAEALGRKMLAVERAAGAAAARPLAEAYLARHPKGAHAAAARRLASP